MSARRPFLLMSRIVARFALALTLAASPASVMAATPPVQPKEGPGGSDYVASEVTKRVIGNASAASFVFHAAGQAANPRPVIVFLHAWGAVNPQSYGGLIEHLARKGYLVVWPRYQEVGKTRPVDATANASSLVKAALEELASDAEAKPDPERVAFVGHLAGAPVAVNLAAQAKTDGLPVPKLVVALTPGGIASDAKARGILLADLKQIDPATLMVTMTGDRDHLPSDRAAKRILKEAEAVPNERKLMIRALSDDHGFPALSATLASPGAPKEAYDGTKIKIPPAPPGDPRVERLKRQKWSADLVLTGEQTVLVAQIGNNAIDTLDYLGFWKTLEMAANAAFSGKDAQALRNDPALTDMGRWSDTWPVRRLTAELPRADAAPVAARAPLAPTKAPVTRRKR
jgi:acetyl esterase/lipase